jgi:probable rRNA maturation factor
MSLNLLQKHKYLRVPARLSGLFYKVLINQGCRYGGDINVILTDDGRIQRLNRDYLGHDRPTDVIAFNLDSESDPHPTSVFGEVYVSLDRAREQAGEQGHSFTREVVILVLHGLFHLFGEKDHTPAARKRMEVRVGTALEIMDWTTSERRGDR